MKITSVRPLAIPDIKLVQFARFCDVRGYFTEPYRTSDFRNHRETRFLDGVKFVQMNESYSRAQVIRGLHFQWNPYMGKLVRTLVGSMVDLVLDIRKGSPTFGKIVAHAMSSTPADDTGEWIWVPPGFAHGNLFTEPTQIEYLCSGEYSPGCEAGISPLSQDLDWSLCDPLLRDRFLSIAGSGCIITEKDRNGLTLEAWTVDPRSENFIFGGT
jgi:dTDP-4-dehydrorhamnose 3,5-epimerase